MGKIGFGTIAECNTEYGGLLVERIESRNGPHTLGHAAEIGLGSREYNPVNIDS